MQELDGPKRLVIVDNSKKNICSIKQIQKLFKAFEKQYWQIDVYSSKEKSISKLKKEALEKAQHNIVALIDNDILFTKPNTLSSLRNVLNEYDISCISPLGYELDNEKPVLNEYSYMYDDIKYDENEVGEGTIALGFFLMLKRKDYLLNKVYYCDDFPYMEDQILVHFLKKHRGYAYLRNQIVYHIAYAENSTYSFDNEQVIRYLESKGDEYSDLLALRKESKDGAEFSKPIRRKDV
jgi:hypothetical protein